jgi:predicted phage tail protein
MGSRVTDQVYSADSIDNPGALGQTIRSTGSETQTISMTDVLSEGPIYGLVDGLSSVHLNDDRMTVPSVCPKLLSRGPSFYRAVNNATTADLVVFGTTLELNAEAEKSVRAFVVRDDLSTSVSLQKKKVNSSNGSKTKLVLSKNNLRSIVRSDYVSIEETYGTSGNSRGKLLHAEVIKPIRLRNQFGDEIVGRLQDETVSNMQRLDNSDELVFIPSAFDKTNTPETLSKTFDPLNEDFTGSGFELFLDNVIDITAINSETLNADGSITYNVTLSEAWTKNSSEGFSGGSAGGGSGNSEIVLGSNIFTTGDRVLYNAGGSTKLTNLTENTVDYFIYKVNTNTVALAPTRADAVAGTNLIDTSASGGSGHTLQLVGQKFDDLGYAFNMEEVQDHMSEASVFSTVESTQLQFRTGTLNQPPMSGSGGVGSSAISNAIGTGISQTNESDYGGNQAPIVLSGISTNGFGLSASTAPEVDQIRIRWNYANGFKGVKSNGDVMYTYVNYKVSIFVKLPGSLNYSTTPVVIRKVKHQGLHNNAVGFEETFETGRFAPFDDFQVKIEREYADDGDAYSTAGGKRKGGSTNVTKASIISVTSILQEKLSHPLTAMAKVSYSSKTFQQTPLRSYHCRGMLIKVPSNYLTREETGGAANYNRNSDGVDTGVYQDWDGTFRSNVYTNNPAWIFYDIVTNNRYGLGDFVNESDIDKYALYRIARYCDEEVDDGKGTNTTEPRYTMNTYLTKSADAQKVLKDMLTNFVSMLYYLDGQIHPVQDSPSGPVYNFTKANVLNGEFTYEHAGTKTRTNQVVVSWNNPENNFLAEPLIVEDRKDIVKTGKTINKKVIAYGCTSRGQATRYGKWKLFTSINQQEIVSFATGINGSFITPGDVINVQDADKHAVRLGGRISNTGTLNSITIPLDSAVTIDTNNTYELSVILQKDAAFLTQDSASIAFTDATCDTTTSDKTVAHNANSAIRPGLKVTGTGIPADTVVASLNSTTSFELSNTITGSGQTDVSLTFTADYVQGDSVTHAYIDSNSDGTYTLQAIDSSTDAVNAKSSATGAEGLLLAYKDAFVVETQAVDKTATGTGSQSSIVVSTGFTSAPTAEDMWVITEKDSTGLNIEGSAKEYKVLAIAEDDKHNYAITAVEHFDSKYDVIEQDFSLYVPDEIYRTIKSTDIIPSPSDAFVQVIQTPAGEHETVRVFFTPAKASTLTLTGSDGEDTTADRELNYEYSNSIEISHNLPGYSSPLLVPYEASIGYYDFFEIPAGDYEVQIRTVASNDNKSTPIRRPFRVKALLRNRIAGYFPEAAHSGGSSTKGIEII